MRAESSAAVEQKEAPLTPSIGRTVHFIPSEACAEKHGPSVAAAIITCVHNPTCVNLKVFWDDDEIEHITSVPHDDSQAPKAFSWRWPPREPS